MADASVRAARADDATAIAALQLRTWRMTCVDVLPADALHDVEESDVAQQWRDSTARPPSPRHRVLVAVEGPHVVGMTATAPAGDLDSAALLEGEVVALLVDHDHARIGHGSRLLTAAIDYLRGDGFRRAQTWVLEGDQAMEAFLVSAGWAPDGVRRELPMSRPVHQRRFHTDIRDDDAAATGGAA